MKPSFELPNGFTLTVMGYLMNIENEAGDVHVQLCVLVKFIYMYTLYSDVYMYSYVYYLYMYICTAICTCTRTFVQLCILVQCTCTAMCTTCTCTFVQLCVHV